jgi:polygalacturonase
VWACWLLQCERVKIHGARIDNPISPNRDGIDMDGCREVHISNCNFKTEDDSIAFKVSEKGFPCRDITVTNCLISSKCAAIRMGPDAIDNIENISISNCVIRDTRLNGIKIQESMGGTMKNITFSNIVMDNVNGPVSIRCAGWQLPANESAPFEINDSNWENGKLQNILFNNIQGTMPKDNHAISITGTTKTRPRDITFSNIDLTYSGGGTAEQGSRRDVPDLDRHYPEMYIFGDLPAYAMYMHHVSGIILNNVMIRLQSDDMRPAIVCDDVDNLELSGFKVAGTKTAESVIRLQNAKNVFINASKTLNETGTFLRVEGAQSKDILLSGNKLNMSAKVIETTGDVPKDAVTQR